VFRDKLESLGAIVKIVPRFDSPHRFSNKLRFYEQPEIHSAKIALLLDCDTVLVQDPTPWLRDDVLQAKIADLPTVPTATLASVCRHFGIVEPDASYQTTFDDVPTIVYCNSGVVAMPTSLMPLMVPRWNMFVRELMACPSLLGNVHYCDQVALALAYLTAGIGFDELPVSMNFPLHITNRRSRIDLHDVDPVILHYHRQIDDDGFIRPSPYRSAQRRIAAFNRRHLRALSESPD